MSLTPQMQAQLASLKDIHLPNAISWWPLAPAWWYLFASLLFTVLAVAYFRYQQRRTVRYIALKELHQLQTNQQHDSTYALAAQISVLLHRVVRQQQGIKSSTLSGDKWRELLTQGKHGLNQEYADLLVNAPYAPKDHTTHLSNQALIDAVANWLRKTR